MSNKTRTRARTHSADSLAKFSPHPANPRTIGEDALEALGKSMAEFGDLSGLVLNRRSQRFITGHQRAKHLPSAGKVVTVETFARSAVGTVGLGYVEHRGERWAVRLVDVDQDTELAMCLAANRHGGTWDAGLLRRALRHMPKGRQALAGFTPTELAKLFAAVDATAHRPRGAATPDASDDAPPPVPEAPRSQLGEIYELGPHRLVCGDSLNGDALERLLGKVRVDMVLMDPPYAIYGSSTGLGPDITDDKVVRPFFREALLFAKRWTREFGHAYVFCDWRSWGLWWEVARQSGLACKNLLVWDKGDAGLGSNYANTHELVGYYVNVPAQKGIGQGRRGERQIMRPNILRGHQRARGDDRLHNAAKPTSLLAELVQNSTDKGETVLDGFVGSGSTLIACERLGRICFAADVDAKWCDVTRQRYADVTGEVKYSPTGTLTKRAKGAK